MRSFYDISLRDRGRRLRRLALKALINYDLAITRIRLLSSAFNAVFQVTTADSRKFVLRIGRPDSGHGLDDFRSAVIWLQALERDTLLGIPQPIPDRNGKFITSVSLEGIPEPRWCMVFTWVPGVVLAQRLTATAMKSLGRTMALLHDQAETWSPPSNFKVRSLNNVFPYNDTGFKDREPIVFFRSEHEQWFPEPRRTMFAETIDRIQRTLDRLYSDPTGLRVIHNDIHLWNVKVHGRAIYLFDFEDLMWGYPIQDLATTIFYFRAYERFDTLFWALREGYASVRTFPFDDLVEIEPYLLARGLMLANFVLSTAELEYRKKAPEILDRLEGKIMAFLAG